MPRQHTNRDRFDSHSKKHNQAPHQTHAEKQANTAQRYLKREAATKQAQSITIDPRILLLAMTLALTGKIAPAAAQEDVYGVQNTVTNHDDPSFYQLPYRDSQTRNIVLTQGVNITNTTGNETSWYIQILNQVAMQWNQEVNSRTQYVDHRHYDSHGNYWYTSHDLENMASQLFVEEFGNSMGNHVSDALLPIAPLFFQNHTIRTACTTLLSAFSNVDFSGTLSNVPVELCEMVKNGVISQAQTSAAEAVAAVRKNNLALIALIAVAYPGFAFGYTGYQKLCNGDSRPLPEVLCEGFLLPFMCCAAICGSRRRNTHVSHMPYNTSYAGRPEPELVAIDMHETLRNNADANVQGPVIGDVIAVAAIPTGVTTAGVFSHSPAADYYDTARPPSPFIFAAV